MSENLPPSFETLSHTCAWCNRRLSDDEDTFGFGAKSNTNLKLDDSGGEFVTLNLSLTDKTIIALVTPEDSPAKETGYDLMFLTCSEECAQDLKDALDLERDVFSD